MMAEFRITDAEKDPERPGLRDGSEAVTTSRGLYSVAPRATDGIPSGQKNRIAAAMAGPSSDEAPIAPTPEEE